MINKRVPECHHSEAQWSIREDVACYEPELALRFFDEEEEHEVALVFRSEEEAEERMGAGWAQEFLSMSIVRQTSRNFLVKYYCFV